MSSCSKPDITEKMPQHADGSARFSKRLIRGHALGDWACWIVLVASPAIMLALLSLASGNDCFSGLPLWSDEVDYWREMHSWVNAPDHAFGYYGFLGHPASVGEWGCHGIAPLLLYGIPGLLFGWHPSSIVLINMVWCMAAFAIFIALVRPDAKRSALIIVLWLLYPPLFSYAPTSMIEMPQYAGVIIFTGILMRFIQHRSKAVLAALFIWVFFFAGLRVSNIVFFIPAVLFAADLKFGKKMIAAALVALFLSGVAWVFFGAFNAGYPGGFMASMAEEPSFAGKMAMIASNAYGNLRNWFAFDEGIKQASQRYAYDLATLLSLVGAIAFGRRRGKGESVAASSTMARICVASFLVLFAAFFIVISVYDAFDWRDYRTLAPILWSQFLLFAAAGKKREGAIVLALTLVLFVAAMRTIFDTAAFEEERYQDVPDPPLALPEQMAENAQDDPAGSTMVLMESGETLWLAFGLDPSIGYVGYGNANPSELAGMGYLYAPEGLEVPDGFEPIWNADGHIIYANSRTRAEG